MGLEWLFIAVIILIVFAVFDLIAGVSNDAVNFINSAIGSHVASRNVILIVASIGIMVGVGFSSGMMEVARKWNFQSAVFYHARFIDHFSRRGNDDVHLTRPV